MISCKCHKSTLTCERWGYTRNSTYILIQGAGGTIIVDINRNDVSSSHLNTVLQPPYFVCPHTIGSIQFELEDRAVRCLSKERERYL